MNTENHPHTLVSLTESIEDLPSIPETLIRILRVLEDPVSSTQALAEVIQYDAPLTTNVLRLANSPFYPHIGEPLTDINSCVRVLGYRTLRQVAICVSIASSLVKACEQVRTRIDYRELWRHSVMTAAMSREVARIAGHDQADELFTAGLLHDLGKFLLVLQVNPAYDELIGERAEQGLVLVDLERERFGFDHADVGAAYMRYWHFPEVLVAVCRGHHGYRQGKPEKSNAVALVALADYLANTIDPPASDLGFSREHINPADLAAAAGIGEADLSSNAAALDAVRNQSRELLDLA